MTRRSPIAVCPAIPSTGRSRQTLQNVQPSTSPSRQTGTPPAIQYLPSDGTGNQPPRRRHRPRLPPPSPAADPRPRSVRLLHMNPSPAYRTVAWPTGRGAECRFRRQSPKIGRCNHSRSPGGPPSLALALSVDGQAHAKVSTAAAPPRRWTDHLQNGGCTESSNGIWLSASSRLTILSCPRNDSCTS
jgi:hypothetical protein